MLIDNGNLFIFVDERVHFIFLIDDIRVAKDGYVLDIRASSWLCGNGLVGDFYIGI